LSHPGLIIDIIAYKIKAKMYKSSIIDIILCKDQKEILQVIDILLKVPLNTKNQIISIIKQLA
jgi:hypothetical protein